MAPVVAAQSDTPFMDRLRQSEEADGVKYNKPSMELLAQGIMSEEDDLQFAALVHMRRSLTRVAHPPVEEAINVPGLLRKIVSFLSHPSHEFQYEAVWILTNLSSGNEEQTTAVVEAGAVPFLMQLLHSPRLRIKEQSAWSLGNLSGDNAHLRDQLLHVGVLDALIEVALPDAPPKFLHQVVWTIQNFFRWKSPPCPLEYAQRVLPVLKPLVDWEDEEDEEHTISIAANATWTVCYIADSHVTTYDYIHGNFAAKFTDNLEGGFTNAQLPSLRTLGTLMSGSAEQTDRVLELGFLSQCRRLLWSPKPNIRKDTAWAISNVAAGTHLQIKRIIDEGLVPDLVTVANSDDISRVRQEGVWALCNMANAGHSMQVRFLASPANGVMAPLARMTHAECTPAILVAVLEAIFTLLSRGCDEDRYDNTRMLVEMNAVEKISMFAMSENEDEAAAARRIMNRFFPQDMEALAERLGEQRIGLNDNNDNNN